MKMTQAPAYVRSLNEDLAQDRAANDAKAAVNAQAARERFVPLEDRLTRLLSTIPAEVQREGLSLPAIQSALRGKWRGKAHPGELGVALRKLGFERRRNWKKGGGFSALWFRN